MPKILGNTTATTMMAEQTYNPQSSKPQSGKAVAEAIAKLLGSAPENLDTLEELAKALNEDENFSASVLAEIAKKADATALANKVDKVSGKGLSEANFTNKEKEKLSQTQIFTNALKTRLENNTFDYYHSLEYPNDFEVEFENLLNECTDEGVHLIFVRESDDSNSRFYILTVGMYTIFEDDIETFCYQSLFNLINGTLEVRDGIGSEWQKISVSQNDITNATKGLAKKTDLDNAIGDVETSLENIIKKYGLGGDGV